ncbi:N-acetylmuramoyl-L-alanine amidase [Gulbenkiania mobilis]|uniref:N-acetylmuramoyl-L-alanine amidase n=1 Tax=Gulbenkiania mobilis TaxID=397457 RepID=UPI0006BBB553|nr:N-acetylmuramoyl-L-alanine amidase [Gulbenkiania mobilis]
MPRTITDIVIHCAATPNGKLVTREQIDAMHRQRGFQRQLAAITRYQPVLQHTLPSIGYHWVIELGGQLKPGRHPEEIGAHVQGSNAKSLGICLIGTDSFSLEQWATLKVLVSNLRQNNPAARIRGHRDFSPDLDGDGVIERHEWLKICPGFDVKSWLDGGMKPLAGHLQGGV